MEQSLRHTERNMRCRLQVITSCVIAGIAFVVFATTVNAVTTTPTTMNFQGRLTTNTGAAVADGLYNVKFAIYDNPTAGSVQWAETRETTNRVQVTNGLFSTQLGAVTPLPASVFAAAGRYFEVTMATPATANCSTASCATWEAAMTPRSTIATSAYAYNSETLDGLDSADFIRNQNVSAQTSTNLWIDGTARAATIQAANGLIIPGTNNESVFTVQNAGTAPVFNVDTTNGEVELGSASLAGKLVISDGSSNKITLAVGAMSGDYTLTLPTAVGASGDCLKTSDTSGTLIFGGCAAGGGVTTVGALDGGTANANGTTISGTTIYLQSASASYAGLVNTSTQTFAGAKTFDDSLTLAAAKTITMVGGNFGSRPGSPAEGTLYYDTDSHQMVQWNGTKWVNSGSDAYLVAASNSSQADKDAADYVVDGTADQTEINSALDRADPASAISGARKSGKVYLFAGTYTTNDVISIPNNTTLAGSGRGSLIQFANINGQTKNMITNSDITTGTGVTVRDLQLDGNDTVNTSGTMHGMYFDGMGAGSGASARQGANIINNWVNNFFTSGMYFTGSPNSTVIGNNVQGNSGSGIYISSSNRSNITNNISQGNGGSGIVLAGAISENVVANTIAANGTAGIYINGSSNNNTIFGNNFYNNGGNTANNAIHFPASANGDFNTITNNTINDTSGTTTNYAINFVDNTSNSNYLADNVFTSTAGTSTINDPAGTNTIYANQSRAEGGAKLTNRTANDVEAFGIQNASGTSIFVVDTTNSEVEIGSSTVAGKIVVSDGSSNTATISSAALAGNYTVDIPTITANDTFCLQSLGNCAGGGATLQTAYGNSGTPATITTTAAKGVTIAAGAAPTADIFTVSNTGFATTTANVNGIQVNYAGGAAAVEGSGTRVDLTPGTTSGGTWNGMRVVAAATGAVSGVTENGIKLTGPTAPGAGLEVALSIDANWDAGIQIEGKSSEPPTPASGNILIYAQKYANRNLLSQKGSSGVAFAYQPAFFEQSISMLQPGTGTAMTAFGPPWTTDTTGSHPAPSEAYGSHAQYATAATAADTAGIYQTTAQFFRGSAANSANGFFAVFRIAPSDASYGSGATGARIWVGMSNQTTGLVTADSVAAGHYAGFQYSTNRGDTNWMLLTNNGGSHTAVSTGMTFTVAKVYDMYVYTPPQGTTVYWRIDNVTDGTTQEGSTTTALPGTTTALRPGINLATLTTTARNIKVNKVYVEADR